MDLSSLPSKLAHLKICLGRLPGLFGHAEKPAGKLLAPSALGEVRWRRLPGSAAHCGKYDRSEKYRIAQRSARGRHGSTPSRVGHISPIHRSGDFRPDLGSQKVASKPDFQMRQLAWKSSLAELARMQLRPQAAKEGRARRQKPKKTAAQVLAKRQLGKQASGLLTAARRPALPASTEFLAARQLAGKPSPADFRERQNAAQSSIAWWSPRCKTPDAF